MCSGRPNSSGIASRQPEPILSGVVECDEVYVVAGHKGHPAAVKKMAQRGGAIVTRRLENVQQATIQPLMEPFIALGTRVYTDEYTIYRRLSECGFDHQTVCYGRGECARDDDGGGFYEVHVNTAEGFCSLLRSRLRPHWGISQEKLPLYLGFFQFVHNARIRGKGLLQPLLQLLMA